MKSVFQILATILWKSDKPVDITFVFWKLEELFVMKVSIQLGLVRLLKQVGSLTMFFALISKRNRKRHG